MTATAYLTAADLPDDVRARVCNGAGPRGLGWLVPDLLPQWTAAADDHDAGYAAGGTASDRREVDQRFARDLITGAAAWAFADVSTWRLVVRLAVLGPLVMAAIYAYYLAVRIGGGWGPWTWASWPLTADEVVRRALAELGEDS